MIITSRCCRLHDPDLVCSCHHWTTRIFPFCFPTFWIRLLWILPSPASSRLSLTGRPTEGWLEQVACGSLLPRSACRPTGGRLPVSAYVWLVPHHRRPLVCTAYLCICLCLCRNAGFVDVCPSCRNLGNRAGNSRGVQVIRKKNPCKMAVLWPSAASSG